MPMSPRTARIVAGPERACESRGHGESGPSRRLAPNAPLVVQDASVVGGAGYAWVVPCGGSERGDKRPGWGTEVEEMFGAVCRTRRTSAVRSLERVVCASKLEIGELLTLGAPSLPAPGTVQLRLVVRIALPASPASHDRLLPCSRAPHHFGHRDCEPATPPQSALCKCLWDSLRRAPSLHSCH